MEDNGGSSGLIDTEGMLAHWKKKKEKIRQTMQGEFIFCTH
jgi:hypothetical protein